MSRLRDLLRVATPSACNVQREELRVVQQAATRNHTVQQLINGWHTQPLPTDTFDFVTLQSTGRNHPTRWSRKPGGGNTGSGAGSASC
jgi:hypothetical protein